MNIYLIYLLAYAIMMGISTIHMMFNWKVLHHGFYTSLEEVKTLGTNVEAYDKTAPWQPLYNLVVFSVLSAVYLQGLAPMQLLWIGVQWVILAAVSDPLLWVLIPHPWRMTWGEFYKKHMPWLLLCYLCVLASPFVALLL